MASTSQDRVLSLDVIRGIAVMGIFSVNVVGMALIDAAYDYPPAFGFQSFGDKVMWAANFILVDGKLRALFSILFGASCVLVIERGMAAGKRDWEVHYPRMIVLLLFGLAHFYLLWWGDILANYALVGMIAFLFWRLPLRLLVLAAIVVLSANYLPMIYFGGRDVSRYEAKALPSATPAQRAALSKQLAELHPGAKALAEAKAQHASIPAHVRAMLKDHPLRPFQSLAGYGLETLGLMLLGMVGYKSGFLTGQWRRRDYARVASVALGASLVIYGYATWRVLHADFSPFAYFLWDEIYVGWMRPIAALGYAALIMVLLDSRGAVTGWIAPVGRAAFTNYLGATLLGTLLFYGMGFGLFGEVSRGQAWLFAPLAGALMLLWSRPWLDRFRYGPFEWAWRSLSRWRWEPMRKVSPSASRAEVSPAA